MCIMVYMYIMVHVHNATTSHYAHVHVDVQDVHVQNVHCKKFTFRNFILIQLRHTFLMQSINCIIVARADERTNEQTLSMFLAVYPTASSILYTINIGRTTSSTTYYY